MEASAKRCRVKIHDVCDAARIARSTWANWKSGKFSPRMATWAKAKAALATAIEASDPGPTKLRRR